MGKIKNGKYIDIGDAKIYYETLWERRTITFTSRK